MAHTWPPDHTKEQVEFMLISMRQQALRSRIPFTFPSTEETNQELQPFIDSIKKTLSEDIPTPVNAVNFSPQNFVDDNPSNLSSVEDPKPNSEDDLSDEIMFEEDNPIVGAILIPSTFNLLQKPSCSKSHLILVSPHPSRNLKKKISK